MKFTILVGIAVVLAMLTTASATTMIFNGDFSLGDTGFSTQYTPGGGGARSYDITDSSSSINGAFVSIGDHTQDTAGMMMVVNGNEVAAPVVWSQSIAVLPNTTYTFSAWVANVCCIPDWIISGPRDPSPAKLSFQFNGIQLGNLFVADTPGEWKQFNATWFSDGNTTLSLGIYDFNTASNGNDFALDDIRLQGPPSAVPLSPSAVQFVLGLGLIGLLMWRRNRKATLAVRRAASS